MNFLHRNPVSHLQFTFQLPLLQNNPTLLPLLLPQHALPVRPHHPLPNSLTLKPPSFGLNLPFQPKARGPPLKLQHVISYNTVLK